MDFEEYRRMDAMAMAAAVADGQTTARELLKCALARTDAVNPQLNAVVARRDARAREEAAGPPAGPFAGVPFLVKDLFQELAGEGSDRGCRALRDAGASAEVEAEITRRWRAAGLVVFGRTNTPEFGARSVTEPVIHGPARNPWDPALSPGGSSGGAAAAVAAGIVPVAGADDGGGSIRIPASHCGLFGFKPGRGRTPAGPAFSEWMHGAAVHHVISRSVRDSAALLDAALGARPQGRFPRRWRPYPVPCTSGIRPAHRSGRRCIPNAVRPWRGRPACWRGWVTMSRRRNRRSTVSSWRATG